LYIIRLSLVYPSEDALRDRGNIYIYFMRKIQNGSVLSQGGGLKFKGLTGKHFTFIGICSAEASY